nr:MAG TPA: hypothetical protein [Inoviridae sp.]
MRINKNPQTVFLKRFEGFGFGILLLPVELIFGCF